MGVEELDDVEIRGRRTDVTQQQDAWRMTTGVWRL